MLERGMRIVEIFKQAQFKPVSVPVQVSILWAVQNGYFDDVAVEEMDATQDAITAYLQDRKANLLSKITTEGKLDDATEAELKSAIEDFKSANK